MASSQRPGAGFKGRSFPGPPAFRDGRRVPGSEGFEGQRVFLAEHETGASGEGESVSVTPGAADHHPPIAASCDRLAESRIERRTFGES